MRRQPFLDHHSRADRQMLSPSRCMDGPNIIHQRFQDCVGVFDIVRRDRQPAGHLACVFGAIAVLIEERSSQATTSPRLSLPSVECAAPSSWAGIRKPSQKPEKRQRTANNRTYSPLLTVGKVCIRALPLYRDGRISGRKVYASIAIAMIAMA